MLKDILNNRIQEYINDNKIKEYIDLNHDFNVEFLAQGEYNINFTLEDKSRKYVFRVNTASQLNIDNQIKYEYDALKKLEISNVTPKVYYLDDSKSYFDYGILIMEFLYGNPLDYKQDLNKAADIFASIHSLDINNMNISNFIVEENIFEDRILEGKNLLKSFFDYDNADKNLKRFFYDFLNWCEINKYKEKYFIDNKYHVINNTEVNSHNFIIGDEKSYLIDWEKPVISDPCQDITQFLAPTTTLWKSNYILSDEEKNGFFNTYISKVNRNSIRERVHLYTPYLYLRALSWCAYAYVEYQDPNKDIQNIDTFNKIKSYLDIDFMNKLLKEYMNK